MINATTINQIKEHAVDMDWHVAFNGKSNGNRHLFRVNKIARFLAQRENANLEITIAGAWLHDIGLIAGDDGNPVVIKKIAIDFLNSLSLSKIDIEQIAACVESHEGKAKPRTLEAKIVHDADVLDKTGILGVIRHTWKITNLISPDAQVEEIANILEAHLKWRQTQLFTATARTLARRFDHEVNNFFSDKRKAILTINEIKLLAKQGITTERIAKKLVKDRKDKFSKSLISQLRCTFLI